MNLRFLLQYSLKGRSESLWACSRSSARLRPECHQSLHGRHLSKPSGCVTLRLTSLFMSLFRTRLVQGFPLLVGHAVNLFPRSRVGHLEAAFTGFCAIPFRKAVAAKSGQIHQINVLNARVVS